ncbi:M24 family metallopeptidase [Tsukamurella tyrosinosolvens]|uniref:M24 family metallopeptidase n=1 Tax=Tsukamurella tyrosinosolvens TaxID=57704 RepID=UPI003F4A51A9
MLTLTTDSATVFEEFGLDSQKSLLFSAIRLDSHPLVAPVIARLPGEENVLLVRQQEQGNVLSAGVDRARIRFYAPWVTIDPAPVEGIDVAPSLVDLVAELTGDQSVRLSHEVAYVHLLALEAASQNVDVQSRAPEAVTVHSVPTADVESRFAKWRATGAQVAARLVAGVEHLAGIEDEFGTRDSRFDKLTATAAERGIETWLLAAPPNFTEIVGSEQVDGAAALWIAGADRVLVIAPAARASEAASLYGSPIGRAASLADAVAAHKVGESVAVEEEWISAGLARELEALGVALHPRSQDLAHWRDVRDNEDLPFQVIAARTSVYAIEEALAWAARQIDTRAPITELDIFEVYKNKIVEFRQDNEIPFDIRPYFTNLHSSNRMLFPGPPVDFPIDESTRCIQLDAGVKVEADGVVLATSDMARSLPRTSAAKEAYELFFDVVREGIIGQLRPGVVCEDVHEGTLRYLEAHLPRLIDIGMLGADTDFNTIYRRRNVGHLMGKQESFANELRPGYKHTIDVGSYGAAEIPWRYNGVAIGTEDLWYVGADRTYIVSKR